MPDPFVADADFTLYVGDVREVLATLPDESVHCVVTSPPYWGLRDYGTGLWEGGDERCDHKQRQNHGHAGDVGERNADGNAFRNSSRYVNQGDQAGDVCGKCGARRVDQQLGLEPTPDEYVANMVAVFREVRRVLRRDGTCWLNIGDTYNSRLNGSHGGWNGSSPEPQRTMNDGASVTISAPGLKPKDLVGIPWRLAFALQADGWYLRSDIVWSKPNPMPESVTDRPTKAHEYVFLLTRSPRYFFDQEAVREPAEWARWGDQTNGKHEGSGSAAGWIGAKPKDELQARATPSWQERKAAGATRGNLAFGDNVGAGTQRSVHGEGLSHDLGDPSRGRNVRSVWEIATQPYAEAHFATFPEALVERCVKAGTSERGCCPECGAPWEREIERGESDYARLKREQGHEWTDMDAAGLARGVILKEGEGGQTRNANGTVPSLRAAERTQRSWRPSCSCGTSHVPSVPHDDVDPEYLLGEVPVLRSDLRAIPCVVLDPFMGSGTTALVARRLGRHSIGIELNTEYAELAARRLQQLSLLA